MSLYSERITKVTGVTDAGDLVALEQLMRDVQDTGCLDALSAEMFRRDALQAVKTLAELDAVDPEVATFYRTATA